MKLLRSGVLVVISLAATSVRAPCFAGEERLGLTPTGAVTLDGFSLQRSTTSGRYQADGGIDFDVNATNLAAIDSGGECITVAGTVSLTVTDPFSGVTATVQAVKP